MDYSTIAIIIGSIFGLVGAVWGGWAAAKGQFKKKVQEAIELLTTVRDAMEDDKLTKEEIKAIVDKAKDLISLNKEKTDA